MPLGKDLLVLPGFTAGDAATRDLLRVRRSRPVLSPAAGSEAFDIATVDGRENLAQALILRLVTPRGALAALGHAAYGSRLHELIGRNKTEALRNLCRAFVLEAVAQEPRVENEALVLEFDHAAETPSSFVFRLDVRPREGGDAVSLLLEAAV